MVLGKGFLKLMTTRDIFDFNCFGVLQIWALVCKTRFTHYCQLYWGGYNNNTKTTYYMHNLTFMDASKINLPLLLQQNTQTHKHACHFKFILKSRRKYQFYGNETILQATLRLNKDTFINQCMLGIKMYFNAKFIFHWHEYNFFSKSCHAYKFTFF